MKTQSYLFAPAHAHYFYADASATMSHGHAVSLFTYPVNGSSSDNHVHRFQGTTDYRLGHFHRISGVTGPPIKLASGFHVHAIFGEVNDEPFKFFGGFYRTVQSIRRHTHSFIGRSSAPLGYEPPDW